MNRDGTASPTRTRAPATRRSCSSTAGRATTPISRRRSSTSGGSTAPSPSTCAGTVRATSPEQATPSPASPTTWPGSASSSASRARSSSGTAWAARWSSTWPRGYPDLPRVVVMVDAAPIVGSSPPAEMAAEISAALAGPDGGRHPRRDHRRHDRQPPSRPGPAGPDPAGHRRGARPRRRFRGRQHRPLGR